MASGGEAVKETQGMLMRLEEENSALKASLSQAESALAREQDKLRSLQVSNSNIRE